MSTKATGTFRMNKWDEKSYSEVENGRKLTSASVSNSFTGDIEGEGALTYLLCYKDDKHASFIGMERVTGSLAGRTGSFVIQNSGVYEDGTAKGTWSIVPGSGTGDLAGLRGEGTFDARSGQEDTPFVLDYDFA